VSAKALEKNLPGGVAAPHSSPSSVRQLSIEERRRLVAASLQVGNPGNNATDLPTQADPRVECQIELAVDDIRPYENNPRRTANARFAEIKESIRASGIRVPLTVTRRPGEPHFIVEAGGNTRLVAIQQLWAETQDLRFRKLNVLFRPWRSESHVLTSHLIENEHRGEMTFWDKAAGFVALKARLEADKGHALSLRQLEDEISGLGLSVNTATLTNCLFATERLRTLGEAIPDLSGLDVKTMQPRLNAMKRYAQARASLTEDDLYAAVFEPIFRDSAEEYRRSGTFSAAAVCTACEEALARRLGEPDEQLRAALQGFSRASHAALRAGSSIPMRTVEPASAATGDTPDSTTNDTPAGRRCNGPVRTQSSTAAQHQVPADELIEKVRVFAAIAGIGDFVRLQPGAALGYSLEPLPIAADAELPARQRAWWLLAVLSGQFNDAEPIDGFPLEAAFVRWLLDAGDDASVAFWHILSLVRRSRKPVDYRGEPGRGMPAPGNA
jgi:ParB family protein of integrating conjugative element (PFGI_1 class)